MTFYEAAVEVLRRSGRPLHFKKITEVAMRDQLLSHLGKTPEVTMEDRLDLETKKEDDSWIVRTRPGVYMLRAEVADELNAKAKAKEEELRKKKEEAERAAAEAAAEAADDSEAEDEAEVEAEDEDEDEDDAEAEDEDEDEDEAEGEDDGDTEEAQELDAEDNGERSGRRRRRRRGRRRGSNKTEEGSEDAEEVVAAEQVPAEPVAAEPRAKRGDRRSGRSGRSKKPKREAVSAADLDGERFDSIADAAYAVLRSNGREAHTAAAVAEAVFDKKLVKFHTHDPEATIQAAIVTDNQVLSRGGKRPRFAQYQDGWGLTEWGVSDEGVDRERQILELAKELRDGAQAQLGAAVANLKAEALEMVVMTLLEQLDYRNLKVSKRTSAGDTFFSADWRRGFSELRVCVHVASDADAVLKAGAVKELRGTLEHYSAAEGIIVHVGEVSKEAVRESRKEDKAKVTIIDRKAFVALLVDEGIGVKSFQTPIVMVDTAFIDSLQR